MSTFPTLPSGAQIDSSKYEVTYLDASLRQEMEGGYTITRARFTRPLRKLFKCAYTDLPEADKLIVEAFVLEVHGTASIFTWNNPEDGQVYQVRFKSLPAFQYNGMGTYKIWSCSFELEQA